MRSVNFGDFEWIAEYAIERPADRPNLFTLS
jgi:hypothetical protein